MTTTEAWGADWDDYEPEDLPRHGRYGEPDKRGNAEDRRRRKLWLLRAHDPDLGPDRCRCFRTGCKRILTFDTVTADRIIPGIYGGTYRHENLRAACLHHNIAQSDRMWQMFCPIS